MLLHPKSFHFYIKYNEKVGLKKLSCPLTHFWSLYPLDLESSILENGIACSRWLLKCQYEASCKVLWYYKNISNAFTDCNCVKTFKIHTIGFDIYWFVSQEKTKIITIGYQCICLSSNFALFFFITPSEITQSSNLFALLSTSPTRK